MQIVPKQRLEKPNGNDIVKHKGIIIFLESRHNTTYFRDFVTTRKIIPKIHPTMNCDSILHLIHIQIILRNTMT
jgi:hypothetical protein